ncbi:hypothetical protein GCM10027589_00240 [Actinocorallia lasiicapitis]
MIITLIKAVIDAEAGWSIGASDVGAAAVDKELLTDPAGRPWIPATSLAGSLRAHLRDKGLAEKLMGSPAGAADLQPSRLWLLGANILAAPATAVISSTAIDPQRKAARAKSLRHARIVDEATVIELYGMHEGPLTETELQALASWRPAIGGNRTKGAGRAQLRSLAYRAMDLDQDDDLHAWLTTTGPGRYTALTNVDLPDVDDEPLIDVRFYLSDALHIGTGSQEAGTKAALIRSRGTTPLVPGSTWKGLFRSRVGFILRTVRPDVAACTEQRGCGSCPLCDLFGSTLGRGRLIFTDSPVEKAVTEQRTHVAIDRVTGGARDKLLFTDHVIVRGEMNLRILPLGTVSDWERNLLLHVVHDLNDGLIGVGGGAQRGQGTIRLVPSSPAEPAEPVAVP